jgi:septum formation protein
MSSEPRSPLVILGSRSAQRRGLLELIVPPGRIRVVPPLEEDESGFDGLASEAEIYERLALIARRKSDDVRTQLTGETSGVALTADTTIIAGDDAGRPIVLGKPDPTGDWQETVQDWFQRYYLGRTHLVATAVCLTSAAGERFEFCVTTAVRFRNVEPELLDWYLATGEPLGKAGGYGLQGAGGMFVEHVNGSLSNVIGLPLEATWEALRRLT